MTPLIKLNHPHLVRDAVRLVYNDPLTGGSPDIELSVIDRGTIPIAPKATLTVEIGRTGTPYRLPAGIFEIDRIGRQEMGLRTIGGTGLPLSDPQLKIKRTVDFSDYTLLEILEEIADRYLLTVFSRNLPEIEFSQLAQNDQSDLDFLNGLANRVGAVFKIENNQLIFTLLLDLEKRKPLFSIKSEALFDYSETITGTELYEHLDYEIMLFGEAETIRVSDDRVKNGKVTSYRGAGIAADDENLLMIAGREQLRKINGENHQFVIDIPGEFYLIAGSTFLLDNRLAFVDRVLHSIDTQERKNWLASLNCRFLPGLSS